MRKTAVILALAIVLMPPVTAAAAEETASMARDRSSLTLTVYNDDLALIEEERTVRLGRGLVKLDFLDVPEKLIPESVRLSSKPDPESLNVIEQNYAYDLPSPHNLREKYIGRKVKLLTRNPETGIENIRLATLLANTDPPVFEIDGEITYGHPGRLILPKLPEDLVLRPTLGWLLENNFKGPQRLMVSYLSRGLSWSADYVLLLSEDNSQGDLSAWVTLDNQSGISYEAATLRLVAGKPHTAGPGGSERHRQFEMMRAAASPAPSDVSRQKISEYHLYSFERKTTLKNRQQKQLALLGADNLPLEKSYRYQGSSYYYRQKTIGPIEPEKKVSAFITVENETKSGLGEPLPAGLVRIYKKDPGGNLAFLGEDRIEHTPRGEEFTLEVGQAFDIAVDRKQMEYKRLGDKTYEAAFKITIRNHKKEDITVTVVEPIPGDWLILHSSHRNQKIDASTVEFYIPVKKDAEEILTYRVRINY